MPLLGFTRGDAPETPPPRYASGPTLSGRTIAKALDPAALAAVCQQWLGPVNGPPGSSYQGCYVPQLDAAFYPTGRQDVLAHEMAHARGWNHKANGRGTSDVPLTGVFNPTPAPLTQEQLEYLKSQSATPVATLLAQPVR